MWLNQERFNKSITSLNLPIQSTKAPCTFKSSCLRYCQVTEFGRTEPRFNCLCQILDATRIGCFRNAGLSVLHTASVLSYLHVYLYVSEREYRFHHHPRRQPAKGNAAHH
jgi:hypothetical protein